MCASPELLDYDDVADADLTLNDLIARWHRWASDERGARGYPTVSAGTEMYRTSRQYDDMNGALDQAVENIIMAGVDGCINEVPQPHRNAIWINARNLACGLTVWHSPRLPEDDLARALMVSDARAMLLDLLRQRGLM